MQFACFRINLAGEKFHEYIQKTDDGYNNLDFINEKVPHGSIEIMNGNNYIVEDMVTFLIVKPWNINIQEILTRH